MERLLIATSDDQKGDSRIDHGNACPFRPSNRGDPITRMSGLLANTKLWRQLRSKSVRERRAELLVFVWEGLGSAQIEHVGRHCEWVSKLAGEIAIVCGLDGRGIEIARLAGLFHDIGKILVPNDLLAKPGPLSPIEKMLMGKHISWGVDLCQLLGLGNPICQAVRDHHARFDESGGNVSPQARIVSVADAMATMATRRDYCRARPLEYALAELRRERGGQFDPLVVDTVCFASICKAPDCRSAINN
jgi:putative nucleotidyltransferase with HDIG domain